MSDRKPLPGKFVWFEHVSNDAGRAQSFYADVLGWKARPFPTKDAGYEMIFTGDHRPLRCVHGSNWRHACDHEACANGEDRPTGPTG